MKRKIRTVVALSALALSLAAAGFAVAASGCCVQPEVNGCCANTGSSCCR
jgi:hypothetical protein